MGFDACLRHGHCFASQVHLHSHICIVYVPVLAHLYTSKLHTCILPACTLPRFHKHICTLVCSSFAPTCTFTLPLLHTHTCMCTPTHYCTLPLAHSCTFTLPHTHTHTHTHTHMCIVYAHTHTRPERSISATLSVACSIRFSTSFFWLREKPKKTADESSPCEYVILVSSVLAMNIVCCWCRSLCRRYNGASVTTCRSWQRWRF